MRRSALLLALLLPVLAVVLLASDVIDISGWFASGADETGIEETVWVDHDADETPDGPMLQGRADLAALEAAERARLAAEAGPDGGGPLAGGATGPGVPFKGRVLDPDGRPADGVSVIATANGKELRFATDADGRFDQALPPGRYRLVLRAPDLGSLLVRSYLVDGSNENDVELSLRAPATLKVAILRGAEGVEGVPISITPRGFEESADTTFEGTTGFEGIATFTDVPRANYDVVAEVPDGPTIRQRQGLWADVRELKLVVPEAVTLKGKVTSGREGPGVSGARLTLVVAPNRGNGLFETVFDTDMDGTYEVLVPRGRVRSLEVIAEGFAPWPNPADGRQRKSMYRTLSALRKAKIVTMGVALESGADVVGQVTDETGKPLPGIRLQLKPRRGSAVVVETDTQGRYSGAELNADRYEIYVETPSWFAEVPLVFSVPAQQTDPVTFDFVLHGARTFTGVVLSETSKPVHGARVWIIGGGRPVGSARRAGRLLEVFTDVGGTFRLTDVPREVSVSVRATHGDLEATPVYVSKDKPVPASIRMQLETTGAIEGTCYDLLTRANVADAKIRLQPLGLPNGRSGRVVNVGRNGAFKIGRLIPGSWSLRPEKRGYLKAEPVVVEVAGSDRAISRDLALDPGLVFAGVVTNPNGAPLRKARIDVSGEADRVAVRNRTVTTDNQGRFRLTGYLRGTYRMTVRRGGFRRKVIPNLGGGEENLVIVLDPR